MNPVVRAAGGGIVLGRLLAAAGPRRAFRQRQFVAGLSGRDAAARVYGPMWRAAAEQLGAECVEAGGGRLRLGRGGRWTEVDRQTTPLDPDTARDRALDKAAGHRALRAAGVVVPEHLEYRLRTLGAARAFLRAHGGPVVVKAAAGTGAGWGVTCGVADDAGLLLASLLAARYSDRLLVERQVAGEMYRLLLLDGELLDAVLRRPPHVHGDGRTALGGLIDAENERRAAARGDLGLLPLRVDLDLLLTLRATGRSLRTVPRAGEQVQVKTSTSENRPEENATVHTAPHADVVAQARAAAAAVGLRLAGVDVVTPDLARPLAESGGAVVEVNAGPGLRYHYQVADPGRATPVAVPVLRALLA